MVVFLLVLLVMMVCIVLMLVMVLCFGILGQVIGCMGRLRLLMAGCTEPVKTRNPCLAAGLEIQKIVNNSDGLCCIIAGLRSVTY